MKLMCSILLLLLTVLGSGCDNGRGVNSNPNDPTDLGEKHGKIATVMGVEVQYLEHQILEPKNANSTYKEVAVKYSIKNTTADILQFGLNTEVSFSDGSGIYKSPLGSTLKKESRNETPNNRWPSEIAPNGQIIGWQTGTVEAHVAKMKVKELATTIQVSDDKKMAKITDFTSIPSRHLKLYIIE